MPLPNPELFHITKVAVRLLDLISD
jgi:hypothetical protein